MYFLIGADIVPTKNDQEYFESGKVKDLAGEELYGLLQESSYNIFNLETPLADQDTPILKQGPNLRASTKSARGFRELRVDLFTLANNHILDQGEKGLTSTIGALEQEKIAHFGTGRNLSETVRTHVFAFGDKKIGVYACTENEFSVAVEDSAGANPYDPLWSFDHVTALKEEADYVIVLYHGGKEHFRYPSPGLQKTCRRFIDKGADLVICQHSHCIGCEENYQNGTIVYGQGNFLFDYRDEECWKTGILIRVDEGFQISYVPFAKAGIGVRLAAGEQGDCILKAFRERSEEIKKEGFVEDNYRKYAALKLTEYLSAIAPKRSLLFRVVNKLTGYRFGEWYVKRKYDLPGMVRIANYVECETHRELLLQALKNQYNGTGNP